MPPLTADAPADIQPRIDPGPPSAVPRAAVEAEREVRAAGPAGASRRGGVWLLGSLAAVWAVLVVLAGTTTLLVPEAPEAEDPRIAPAVVVAPVEIGPLVRSRAFSGTLESPAVLSASPLVSGRVASVRVRLGDEVQPGATLLTLVPDELEQAQLAAEAQLAVAKANASEATAAEAIAERTVARVRQLAEEGLTSAAEADTAEAQRLAAAAAVEVADARRLSAEADAGTARIRLSYATVSARFTGPGTRRVAEVSVQEGDSVSPGTELVRLVQLDPLRAVFTATQSDLAGLARGQAVELTTDAYPGRAFPARVDRLAPAFSISSRQARVEADVENGEDLLRPGMFVRLATDLETLADAVSVPRDAVVQRDGETIVFVLPPGSRTATRRGVELGMVAGDRVQVLSPPLEGEVVVLGQQLLKDRTEVNPTRNLGEAVVPEALPEESDGGRGP